MNFKKKVKFSQEFVHPEKIKITCFICKYVTFRKRKRKFTGCIKCYNIICNLCKYKNLNICKKCIFI